MDSEKDVLSCARPAVETTGESMEAAAPSADSIESSRGGRGRTRRERSAATPRGSRSGAVNSVRVLRVRGAGAGTRKEPRNGTSTKKPACPLRGRTTPARSHPQNSPVTQAAIMKSTAMKAPKHSVRSKLSRSGKGKGRPPAGASHTMPATPCKTEAEKEVSFCGKESSTLERNHDNMADPDAVLSKPPAFRGDPGDLICQPETMTQCPTLQYKEVKKEEPEEEEENDNTFKEEVPTKIFAQFEDRVGDKTEPARKRGRQHKDDKASRQPKRRKKPPVQYVRCEIEGCGTVLAHPRYLQHHIKYQHLLKKKYVCGHPSCGRLFRLQKQLLRHAKHHTDQRDYICEFCARAFKSAHNLAVHRMIHTGEKPIQCEICGFTCRQKASLNWHMKKHDAEATYQFSCSICGKKFEKRDSVIAHKAKSHPEVLIAEAVAANGGSVISNHTLVPEVVPVLEKPEQPSVSQEEMGDTLSALQQVVFPLASQTWVDASESQFLPSPTHHVVQVTHQQQAPTLLHLTTTSPAHLSSTSHTHLIQLPSLPASTVTSMTTADSQGTLLTLSSVTTLASQQAVLWGRETDEVTQLSGESEVWDKGEGHQDVGDMIWENNREKRKGDEGIVWEREGERQILLQCPEMNGDSLI